MNILTKDWANNEELKNYLQNKIDNSWYKNAKIDYNLNGSFIDIEVIGNNLYIYHEEEQEKYQTVIAWFEDYNKENIYNIWMEQDWEFVA